MNLNLYKFILDVKNKSVYVSLCDASDFSSLSCMCMRVLVYMYVLCVPVCECLLSGGARCVSRRARLPLDLSSIDKPIRAGDASGSLPAPPPALSGAAGPC